MHLRRVLVTAQFAISLAFVAGALIVQQQLAFLQTADLGFDRAATVTVPLGGWGGQTFARVRAELGDVPGVLGIAALSSIPGGRHGGYSATWPGREGDDLMLRASVASAEAVEALGLRIVAGEALPALAAENEANAFRFVVNEEVARHVAGSNEAAIGHPFVLNGRAGQIAGVVQDFHYASLHEAVGSFALFSEAEPYYSTLVVRLAPNAPGDVLDQLAARWNAAETGRPFVYHFLDEQLGALYAADRQMGSLVGLAALVTVLVACLGLFGLAAFSVGRRRKEIGVRKALGSAAVGIVGLVSREFAALVGLGFLVGAPVAWAFGNWWKQGFAYSAGGAGWAIAQPERSCCCWRWQPSATTRGAPPRSTRRWSCATNSSVRARTRGVRERTAEATTRSARLESVRGTALAAHLVAPLTRLPTPCPPRCSSPGAPSAATSASPLCTSSGSPPDWRACC